MSRHPDNPWWDQDHDAPRMILDQSTWEEAQAAGDLTVEHVLLRLENVAEYELGNGADIGLGADGFLNALVADGWRIDRNVKLRMWPNDHEPAHVHIEFQDRRAPDLKIVIETGELLDCVAPPGQAKHVKQIAARVKEMASMLVDRWTEMQAADRPSA